MSFRKLGYIGFYIKLYRNKTLRLIAFNIFSILILMLLIEGVCFTLIDKKAPYFYNYHTSSYIDNNSLHFGLDPLLGWSIDTNKTNYKIINNCIYLENLQGTSRDTLTIFISGGSTSDVVYQSYNWPILLFDMLKSANVNCKIYIGAVGGYGTSQELLKLLRDGLEIKDLDIHISYFGANETDEPLYVSNYEYDFYNKRNGHPILMPNTILLIKEKLFKKSDLYLTPQSQILAIDQTIKNIKVMSSISKSYNYKYISILQPVIGVGSLDNLYEKYKLYELKESAQLLNYIDRYKNYYKSLSETNQLSVLGTYDFTNIFKDINDNPFLDDCHVKEKYQYIISDKIFDLIMKDSVQVN